MIMQLLISAFAFYVTSYLVPGFVVSGLATLVVMSIVWGILSMLIKPILILLTLPINFLTLGLFTFVINALLLMLMTKIVPGFSISGFGTALLAAIVLSLVNMFLLKLIP